MHSGQRTMRRSSVHFASSTATMPQILGCASDDLLMEVLIPHVVEGGDSKASVVLGAQKMHILETVH